MRPAVLTAFLLLVDFLNTGTVVHGVSSSLLCKGHKAPSCGGGWNRIAPGRCVKSSSSPKSFSDAQRYCRSLKGDLMSIHNHDEMHRMLCYAAVSKTGLQTLWIGAQKFLGRYVYTDGSEFRTSLLSAKPNSLLGKDACIGTKFMDVDKWISVRCSEKKNFLCIRRM